MRSWKFGPGVPWSVISDVPPVCLCSSWGYWSDGATAGVAVASGKKYDVCKKKWVEDISEAACICEPYKCNSLVITKNMRNSAYLRSRSDNAFKLV